MVSKEWLYDNMRGILLNLVYFLLKWIGGNKFSNRDFPASILVKHLIVQKIFRINGHVPWPVHPTSVVSFVEKIEPGTRCPGLSPGCYIQGKNGITLGENVWIGPGVGIISANHSIDNFHSHIEEKPIRIGDNCWIGMNSVILPGVQLGDHVVVGAGSIVTHDFGSNCLIAGNPAKLIRRISAYGTHLWR